MHRTLYGAHSVLMDLSASRPYNFKIPVQISLGQVVKNIVHKLGNGVQRTRS